MLLEYVFAPLFIIGMLAIGGHSLGAFTSSRRRALSESAAKFGLVGEGHAIKGKLRGRPVEISLERVRSGKGYADQVTAFLRVPTSGTDLRLTAEGLASGLARVGGGKELKFEDKNFDHAFWVTGSDREAIEGYLTPSRRAALVDAFERMPSATYEDDIISLRATYKHPFYSSTIFEELLFGLDLVARAFTEENFAYSSSTSVEKSITVRSYVTFAPWMALFAVLFTPLMSYAIPHAEEVGAIYGSLTLVGLICAYLAYNRKKMAGLALRSYFTLLAIAAISLPLLATHFHWQTWVTPVEQTRGMIIGSLTAMACVGIRIWLSSLEKRPVASSALD